MFGSPRHNDSSPPRPIKVAVAAEQVLIAGAITTLLRSEQGIEVVADLMCGDETGRSPADMTVVTGDPSVLGKLHHSAGADVSHPVVAIAGAVPHHVVLGAIRQGCRAIVSDVAVDIELAQAVRAVAGGGVFLSPMMAGPLLDWLAAQLPIDQAPLLDAKLLLTGREQEVLKLLGAGRTNAGIAGVLVISEATVRTHVYRIQTKLGLQSRTEAVILGYQFRLGAAA
ncbi:transcriptional regulator, LuxR family [Kribbella flavida DSM 17836]|uniref:Transcriptional regulator, LuxR family n=1 Tax=Kribbella flavida (strain DSM 17836 / JCM 10339 / NBRC 14399) TaxID=479435 RepID=D2PSM5_KRIFD|nr:response regulator transcription factor [Kribbella flavida]ADB33163.1 transcriptional regulator, LuxR family [Kribbella flavida DSM 17836]